MFNLFEKVADNKRLFIKINAITADIRPIISSPGKAENISNETGSKTNTGSTILILSAEKFEIIDEREIAVNALIEKCLITTSCAKTIPAIGDPNPAEIAAATPAPMIMSCGMFGIKGRLLKNAAKVPPK